VRVHIPTDETELRDLLDRMLDKGLFLGAANLLLLSETDLAAAHCRVRLVSMHINIGYYPVQQRLSHYSRRRIRQKV
jgi:hypothetical protein